MALTIQTIASDNDLLTPEQVRQTLNDGLAGRFAGARVLVLIPDHTRTVPLPLLFRLLVETLRDTRQLDFMVALGTHPALSEDSLNRLVGISADQRATTYRHIGLLNHDWANPEALAHIGTLEKAQIQAIAGDLWHPSLGDDTPVRINRRIFDYDQVLIVGPTFPHEVVGFSGGAKYLFPGISGAEMINTTHWLGALATILNTIGIKDTPVRAMIHAAAEHVPVPVALARPLDAIFGERPLALADARQGAWTLAMGLALRKLRGPFAPADGTTRRMQAEMAEEEAARQQLHAAPTTDMAPPAEPAAAANATAEATDQATAQATAVATAEAEAEVVHA
ncbi:MAG: lactate racemase domain-containing protein [Phototrophicaceae bacterium]